MNRKSLQFLDGLRGLAALYVVVGHARWLLWEGYSEGYVKHPELYPLPAKLLVYFVLIFSFGHQAVMLFFVLSGFVIHLRYAYSLKDTRETAQFDWWPYVKRRAKRLYPPLLFAMVLTFLLDRMGIMLGYPIYFQATPFSLINLNINPHHDLITGLGNLAFVMTVYVPVWGSNGPLWSLMYEWWFYMIYPLFWWLTKRKIVLATIILVALCVLSFVPSGNLLLLARTVFSLMIVWWFGVLLADCYVGRIQFPLWKIGFLALLLPLLIPLVIPFSTLSSPYLTIEDILWGLGFTGLIAAGLAWQNRGNSLWFLDIFKPLGDISYTLYVIHFPILTLLSGILMSQMPNQALPRDFSWTFFGIFVCLTVAYAAHFVTEKPFIRQRDLVRHQSVA
jgi:peptidoglycan/LPS O-acetylase OafA/YrhL